jgi:prevent-host-death family protein
MSEVASCELGNRTADVLRRAAGGENITITVQG